MLKFKFLKIAEYPAVGGPEKQEMGRDSHMKTPTRSGKYVIHSISKHVSYGKYAYFSGVAWGTPLRVNGTKIQIKQNGTWIDLRTLPVFKQYTDQSIINNLSQYYTDLKNQLSTKLSPAELAAPLPDSWIFNDFGHLSIKYFADINNDFKLNKGKESIIGDFIHTTPDNEFYTSHNTPFNLSASHGCIHIKPNDIDAIISLGYVKKGSIIEIRPYTDSGPILMSFEDKTKKTGYELRFYPGLKKLVIYNVKNIT